MIEKLRPALVMSGGYGDLDRVLITVVPHTLSAQRFGRPFAQAFHHVCTSAAISNT